MQPDMATVASLSQRLGTIGMHVFCDGATAAQHWVSVATGDELMVAAERGGQVAAPHLTS